MSIFYLTFVEVVPINDTKEHWLGDECWCLPVKTRILGGIPDLMFTHNSSDRREAIEKKIVVTP